MANRFWVGGTATWNATAGTKWSTTDGGGGGAAVPTTADDVFFTAASGAVTVTQGGAACKSLDFTGFTGTWTGAIALAISNGSLILGAGMTRTYTGSLTMNATSSVSITSNGKTLAGTLTLDGVAGTFTFTDAFENSSGVTLTNGTLVAATSMKSSVFGTNNNNTRVLTVTGTTWLLTGTGTVFTTGNTSGLTINSSGSLFELTNASASAKTFTLGAGFTLGDVKVSGNGSGSYTFGTGAGPTFRDFTIANTGGATVTIQHDTLFVRNFDCTGFTGTLNSSSDGKTLIPSGNITLAAGMTYATGAGTRLRVETQGTSGTQTVTSNGIAFPISFKCNGAGGTVSLADTFATLSTFSVIKGTFLSNAKTMNINQFFSSGTDTRTVNLDGSTVTIDGSATVWTMFDPTGLTFSNVGTTIAFTNAGVVAKSFLGGSQSYNKVKYGGAGGIVSTFTVTGSNTFGTFELTNPPQAVVWESGSTQTITTLTLPFVVGSFGSFTASPAAAEAVLSKLNGVVLTDYLNLTDMKLTGGALWFMGQHSAGSGLIDGARFANRYFSAPPAQYW